MASITKTFWVDIDYPNLDRAMVAAGKRGMLEMESENNQLLRKVPGYQDLYECINIVFVSAAIDITPVSYSVRYHFYALLSTRERWEDE